MRLICALVLTVCGLGAGATACADDDNRKLVVQAVGPGPDDDGLYKVFCWKPGDEDSQVVKNWNPDTQPAPIVGAEWLCNA